VVSAGGGKPRPLTNGRGIRPAWSADGLWIYFGRGRELFKVPASGGEVTQVSRNGGGTPVIAADGTIYLHAGNTIRRMNADGSGEKVVLEGAMQYARNFALASDGIYYHPTGAPNEIRFYSFAKGSSSLILSPKRALFPGLAVSPDGRWLLFGTVDRPAGSDLMLVENFR